MDDCCHDTQNFCFSCIEYVSVVVQQDRFEQWGHHICADHLQIICLLHVRVDELEYFLFDRPKSPNPRCLGSNIAYRSLAIARSI